MPKVTPIKPDHDDLKASLEEMRRNSGAVVEYHTILAGIRFQAFQRYIKAGFSESQALELIKDL